MDKSSNKFLKNHCLYTELEIALEENEKLKNTIKEIFSYVEMCGIKDINLDISYINNLCKGICKCTQKT